MVEAAEEDAKDVDTASDMMSEGRRRMVGSDLLSTQVA